MENILEIRDLNVTIQHPLTKENTRILKNLSLNVTKGKITGVVGESGSGKSMLMKSIKGLLPDTATRSYQSFIYQNQDVKLSGHNSLSITMIFQDPMTSLNPLRTIGYHLLEVIRRFHTKLSKQEQFEKAVEELEKVGISQPTLRMKQYPHELSGGMRQRVLIAMAFLTNADLLIADEPTTALDVTIQAQILALIKERQLKEGLTVLFVTHDFGVVASICEEVKVMYQGRIVEEGTVEDIFYQARHPYTKGLLRAIPSTPGVPLYSMAKDRQSFENSEDASMKKINDRHYVLTEEVTH
ncbi:ABC transporter ATP-binding protein [Vagococcus lutrae]|uniref:ABC transporter ATP-binding protein n=1 Tax=Vagococcus lutrae TaxID=81947 RepID=UPI0035DC926E